MNLKVSSGLVVPEVPETPQTPDRIHQTTWYGRAGRTDNTGQSGTVNLQILLASAVNKLFLLTVTISDDEGIRTVYDRVPQDKDENGAFLTLTGTGKGTVVVMFDNTNVGTYNVDFGHRRYSVMKGTIVKGIGGFYYVD